MVNWFFYTETETAGVTVSCGQSLLSPDRASAGARQGMRTGAPDGAPVKNYQL